jgi:hypothetical protein
MNGIFWQRNIGRLALALAFMGGGCALPAVAQASVVCGGQVKNMYVNSAGNVYILGAWLNTYQQVCNLNAEWNGVSTTTCKGWLSIIEVATAASLNVTITINAVSCTSIPTYESAPPPSYIMINQ